MYKCGLAENKQEATIMLIDLMSPSGLPKE